VGRIIAAAVTQVDAANESHISVGSITVADRDHLLVVRPATADALVEQRLTSRR
jgi:hypothetical protein